MALVGEASLLMLFVDKMSLPSSSSTIVSVKFCLRIATHTLLTDFLCCCAGATKTKHSTVKRIQIGLMIHVYSLWFTVCTRRT